MSMTQEIKDYARSLGMSLVGIASVDRFDDVPYGRKPTDIVPNAKAVVSFGLATLDGVTQAQFRAEEDGEEAARNIYGRYGRGGSNAINLMYTTWAICQFIENRYGYAALPTMTGPWSMGRPFSHRHAAVAAGLGEMGWQNAVITPEFGPRVRWGAIITQAPLDADPVYAGPKLCDAEKCGLCVKKCPTGAISKPGAGKTFTTGGVKFDIGAVDFDRCRIGCFGLEGKVSLDADTKTVDNAVDSIPYEQGRVFRPDTWKCDRCITYCPAGNWKKRFGDRGLSKEAIK